MDEMVGGILSLLLFALLHSGALASDSFKFTKRNREHAEEKLVEFHYETVEEFKFFSYSFALADFRWW
jgi:hypothetical protein